MHEGNVPVRLHLRLVHPELDAASAGGLGTGSYHPKGPATLRGGLPATPFLNTDKGETLDVEVLLELHTAGADARDGFLSRMKREHIGSAEGQGLPLTGRAGRRCSIKRIIPKLDVGPERGRRVKFASAMVELEWTWH